MVGREVEVRVEGFAGMPLETAAGCARESAAFPGTAMALKNKGECLRLRRPQPAATKHSIWHC